MESVIFIPKKEEGIKKVEQLPGKCILCLEHDQKLCDKCDIYHRKYLFMPYSNNSRRNTSEDNNHNGVIMPGFIYWMVSSHHDNALEKIQRQDNQCLHKGYQEAPKIQSGHSYISQHWNKWSKR